MSATSLYNLTGEMMAIEAAIEENGGELTPELEEALAITSENFENKVVSYGNLIQYYTQMQAAAKSEKARIDAIGKYAEKRLADLKRRVTDSMIVLGRDKVESGLMRISLRTSTTTIIDDIELLPTSMVTVKVEKQPNKTAIKEAIKAGATVDGAHLENNVNLVIK